MPDGGLQEPSAVRVTNTPLPPAPDTHKPDRIAVKIARPLASLITYVSCQIFRPPTCLGINLPFVEFSSTLSASDKGHLDSEVALLCKSHPLRRKPLATAHMRNQVPQRTYCKSFSKSWQPSHSLYRVWSARMPPHRVCCSAD